MLWLHGKNFIPKDAFSAFTKRAETFKEAEK